MICEIGAAKRADDQWRGVAVSPIRKRQPCQSQSRKALKDVEDNVFVLAERAQSRRGSNRREERETTRSRNRGNKSANRSNALERHHADTMHSSSRAITSSILYRILFSPRAARRGK